MAVVPGDGIGPEVMRSALKVLNAVDFSPEYVALDVGYERWRREGVAVTQDDIETLKASDVVLKGPVTTPPRRTETFESVTLHIRRALDVYANVRPFKSLPVSPFANIEMIIVRENTEGVYMGKESYNGGVAVTERVITERGSRRIVDYAFKLARRNKRSKVTCIHKANIMKATCGLFRDVFYQVAKRYGDIAHAEMLVDACAHEMIKNPRSLDVLVTTNMFGDILSDEAAALIGSLGLMGSFNIGDRYALFEPVHGTAPDIAGKGKANPIGMIMAASYMLDHIGREYDGASVRTAIEEVLREGVVLTADLGGGSTTEEITQAIISKLVSSR